MPPAVTAGTPRPARASVRGGVKGWFRYGSPGCGRSAVAGLRGGPNTLDSATTEIPVKAFTMQAVRSGAAARAEADR
jgi:hypothetical protein